MRHWQSNKVYKYYFTPPHFFSLSQNEQTKAQSAVENLQDNKLKNLEADALQ